VFVGDPAQNRASIPANTKFDSSLARTIVNGDRISARLRELSRMGGIAFRGTRSYMIHGPGEPMIDESGT
jgi:hypothetical protein